MSIFRVKLNNSKQGNLDIYDNQRTAYITGPNRINRKLKDGELFTDCNYWKRFAYPQVALEEAFIEVVEDDGTIYSDFIQENTYPKVYDINCAPGSSFEENKADIQGESGSWALFAQITNKSTTDSVKIRLNRLPTAVMDLDAGSTQVFNAGEVTIGIIDIDNSEGSSEIPVQIIVSIRTVSKS